MKRRRLRLLFSLMAFPVAAVDAVAVVAAVCTSSSEEFDNEDEGKNVEMKSSHVVGFWLNLVFVDCGAPSSTSSFSPSTSSFSSSPPLSSSPPCSRSPSSATVVAVAAVLLALATEAVTVALMVAVASCCETRRENPCSSNHGSGASGAGCDRSLSFVVVVSSPPFLPPPPAAATTAATMAAAASLLASSPSSGGSGVEVGSGAVWWSPPDL
mmetsp:Transcript_32465/g.66250  ORF Transcript_32465/g.66250 Transcript_32465/m.66250 type:complete len:212 (+) Transcript_32465:846-1481(+)